MKVSSSSIAHDHRRRAAHTTINVAARRVAKRLPTRPDRSARPARTGSQHEQARDLLSREVGYVRKPHAEKLRVALAFPNTYFVGMSNLGFQTVYRLFNDQPGIVCERVFLPPKQE